MKLRASARKIARLVVSRASEMKLKGQNWRVDVVASVKTCAVRCFKMTWTSHAQGNAHILIRVRVPISGVLPPRRSLSLSFKHGIESLLLGQSVDGRIL